MTLFDIIRKFVKEQEVDAQELLGMAGMRERNEARIEQIKREMGDKYILADCHKKSRLDTPSPV